MRENKLKKRIKVAETKINHSYVSYFSVYTLLNVNTIQRKMRWFLASVQIYFHDGNSLVI